VTLGMVCYCVLVYARGANFLYKIVLTFPTIPPPPPPPPGGRDFDEDEGYSLKKTPEYHYLALCASADGLGK
jgi:hypothetical protein